MNSPSSKSRHVQVTDQIRERIRSGELKPGERLPSYNEIRAQEGVHTNTLEKVYAKLELEGLIVRKRGSGTFVAQSPRAAPKATGIIGLSGKGFSFDGYSPYWAQLQGGAHEAATREGMQLLILDPLSSQGWEKADGVLLCDWKSELVSQKASSDQPRVSLMTLVEGVASAAADDYAGMRAATEYLISLGHRKIAYLHGARNSQITCNRMVAYRDALTAARIQRQATWTRLLRGKYDYGTRVSAQANREMLAWMKEDWNDLNCTALLCHNDEAASGAIQALTEKGICVPHDVSVMGFDGTEFCDLISPGLSSVELPLRAIGAAGVQMLLRQIKADEASEEHRVLPPQLRVRQSTAAPSPH